MKRCKIIVLLLASMILMFKAMGQEPPKEEKRTGFRLNIDIGLNSLYMYNMGNRAERAVGFETNIPMGGLNASFHMKYSPKSSIYLKTGLMSDLLNIEYFFQDNMRHQAFGIPLEVGHSANISRTRSYFLELGLMYPFDMLIEKGAEFEGVGMSVFVLGYGNAWELNDTLSLRAEFIWQRWSSLVNTIGITLGLSFNPGRTMRTENH